VARRIRVVAEGREIIRLACISVLGISVVALAMSIKGWAATSLFLGGLIALIAAMLISQIWWVIRDLTSQSARARESAAEAEKHYISVLWRIVRFVEARDKFTRGRSERIGMLSEQMARHMNLDEQTCSVMNQAGRLHDIGMLAIPQRIVARQGAMSIDGFRVVQKHCQIGYEVLRPLESFAPALKAIRYHHERMNGTGYPAGLSGQEIPIEARILAVADAYDAMTHDRPYRPALTHLAAVQELRRCSPDGYDRVCVEALAEIVHVPRLEEALAAAEKPAALVG